MISHARTAMKFLVYGMVIGLLFAPRSGEETRARLMEWAGETIKETMGGIGGGGGTA
ncbi:MAG: YtxH domain-containing protein [Chloroflexota bacterium]|nr:YtxH domain-containing protein [Chloroflexota bacterium]